MRWRAMTLPRRTFDGRGIVAADELEHRLDHRRDVDALGTAAEVLDDAERIGLGGFGAGAIRHAHRQQVLGADGAGREVRHRRRVDAARQPDHQALESSLAHLRADEADDDLDRLRRLERRQRRQVVGHASGSPSIPARSPMMRSSSRRTSSRRSSARIGRP